MVICAVLVAAAIGAGAALALHHRNGASGPGATAVVQGSRPKTSFGSVNALNQRIDLGPGGLAARDGAAFAVQHDGLLHHRRAAGVDREAERLATYFYGPDDMVLDVDLSPHTYPDNMVQEAEHLQQQQAVLGDAFPGYQRRTASGGAGPRHPWRVLAVHLVLE